MAMTAPGLLIAWHGRTGAAQAMAEAAARGAIAADGHNAAITAKAGANLSGAQDVGAEAMLAAAGYLFVLPEYLGTMSGMMKDMFDRVYYPLLGQIEGRPYGVIIAAGSDGHGALAQVVRIVTGWHLRQVADPMVICVDAQTRQAILAPKTISEAVLGRCHELGATLMSGIALGIF